MDVLLHYLVEHSSKKFREVSVFVCIVEHKATQIKYDKTELSSGEVYAVVSMNRVPHPIQGSPRYSPLKCRSLSDPFLPIW